MSLPQLLRFSCRQIVGRKLFVKSAAGNLVSSGPLVMDSGAALAQAFRLLPLPLSV